MTETTEQGEDGRLVEALADCVKALTPFAGALHHFDWNCQQGWPMFTGVSVYRAYEAYINACEALGIEPDPGVLPKEQADAVTDAAAAGQGGAA